MKQFFKFSVVFALSMSLAACDDVITITKPLIPGDDFETPFDMLSQDLNASFFRGEEAFMKGFTVEEGLGPIFNDNSCAGCHPGNGRGTPDSALIRFSIGHDLIPDTGRSTISGQSHSRCALRNNSSRGRQICAASAACIWNGAYRKYPG